MTRRLGPEGLRLRAAVLDKYELAEHEAVLLDSACRLADHVALLDARVAADGVTTTTASGAPKVHPALTEEEMAAISGLGRRDGRLWGGDAETNEEL